MEKEKLVSMLIKMGVNKDIINHMAFDVVVNDLIYKIKKCCDHGLNYNSRVPNSNTIEINGRDNKNDFTTGLNVTKNSIQFYSTKSSNAFVPTEGGANYWTCTIDQYGNLTVKDVFGSSLVKNVNDKVKQFDFSNITTNIYNENGVNTTLEMTNSSNKVNTGIFQPRFPRYYEGINGTQHKWVIRRDGLDYGYAIQYLNGIEQKHGTCIFSGEWGFQKIRLINNGNSSDYIFETDRIPERNEEYYKKSLVCDGNKMTDILLRDWGKTSNELKSRSK